METDAISFITKKVNLAFKNHLLLSLNWKTSESNFWTVNKSTPTIQNCSGYWSEAFNRIEWNFKITQFFNNLNWYLYCLFSLHFLTNFIFNIIWRDFSDWRVLFDIKFEFILIHVQWKKYFQFLKIQIKYS